MVCSRPQRVAGSDIARSSRSLRSLTVEWAVDGAAAAIEYVRVDHRRANVASGAATTAIGLLGACMWKAVFGKGDGSGDSGVAGSGGGNSGECDVIFIFDDAGEIMDIETPGCFPSII